MQFNLNSGNNCMLCFEDFCAFIHLLKSTPWKSHDVSKWYSHYINPEHRLLICHKYQFWMRHWALVRGTPIPIMPMQSGNKFDMRPELCGVKYHLPPWHVYSIFHHEPWSAPKSFGGDAGFKPRTSDQSLPVPDFTISVYGSSCNSLFFGLILSSYLSISISCLTDAN